MAVVRGRTRSLVERFERRENCNTGENNKPNVAQPVNEVAKASPFTTPVSIMEAAQRAPDRGLQLTTEEAKMSPSSAPESAIATQTRNTSLLLVGLCSFMVVFLVLLL